jgi:hypothetical protein
MRYTQLGERGPRVSPGCSALAVTPLPRNRPDSSWVNEMLASFDDDGRAGLGEPTGDPGATPPDAPVTMATRPVRSQRGRGARRFGRDGCAGAGSGHAV